MSYLVLLATNTRDSNFFDESDDNGIWGPTQVRAALETYGDGTCSHYRTGGIVEAADLEIAFRATNIVDGTEAWKERSTSVGDVFVKLDKNNRQCGTFVVASFGFCELADFRVAALL